MNISLKFLLVLAALTLALGTSVALAEDDPDSTAAKPVYRYILEGTSTPEVFAALIANPEDRAENARGLMAAAGCKLIDYYIGINNYKSYVIIECEDPANLNALQMVMFASGAVAEGTATRLVTSAELVGVMEDAGKLVSSYGTPDE